MIYRWSNKCLLHLLLILAVALFTYWEMADIYQQGSRWFPVLKTSAIYLFVVYLNIYLLAPRFLLKRRWYGVYLLAVLYVVLFVYFVEIRLDDAVYLQYTSKIRLLYGKIDINPLLQVFTSIISYVILMISSSAIILFSEWAKQDIRVHDLEQTAMMMELAQLKKQVNPQFLVRMLDHAHELTARGHRNEASALLLKLGAILRYQLYDSARKDVLLSAEIHFLTAYLALEKQFRDGFSFAVESEGNVQSYLIPPLLFLPVVEHFISGNRGFIGLFFGVEDGRLRFECQCPCDSASNGVMSGAEAFVGLCRRLTLLYEDGYSFEIQYDNDVERVRLYIVGARLKSFFTTRDTKITQRTQNEKGQYSTNVGN